MLICYLICVLCVHLWPMHHEPRQPDRPVVGAVSRAGRGLLRPEDPAQARAGVHGHLLAATLRREAAAVALAAAAPPRLALGADGPARADGRRPGRAVLLVGGPQRP